MIPNQGTQESPAEYSSGIEQSKIEEEIKGIIRNYGMADNEDGGKKIHEVSFENISISITQHILSTLPTEINNPKQDSVINNLYDDGFNACLAEIKKNWGIG